jgi:hypothetical protein
VKKSSRHVFMSAERTDKFLIKALKQMFKIVNEKYSVEFTKQNNWYTLCTWTVKQEKVYKVWFIKHIMKDLVLSKKRAEEYYSYFSLMWGWPVSNDVLQKA